MKNKIVHIQFHSQNIKSIILNQEIDKGWIKEKKKMFYYPLFKVETCSTDQKLIGEIVKKK